MFNNRTCVKLREIPLETHLRDSQHNSNCLSISCLVVKINQIQIYLIFSSNMPESVILNTI